MSNEREQAEIESQTRIERDRDTILDAEARGPLAKLWAYTKLSGPGWLQSAITLGGGSLTGSLFLGVLAGFSLLWLQPLAMMLGIVMLSAIGYVALSTNERPFRAINRHVNPVLGWGWLIATIMANMVWCMPQFALGTAALQQNLLPEVLGKPAVEAELAAEGASFTPAQADAFRAEIARRNQWICVGGLFLVGTVVVWFYNSGGWGIKVFEFILKAMVAVVVVSFFAVVIKMSTTGLLDWDKIVSGLVPDLSMLTQPAAAFRETLSQTGAFATFWSDWIVREQQQVMITAAATAVGINMTFLLPYSMLARGWDRDFRGLAIFDLSTGLFVPFVLATGCVIIASASQFHGQPAPGFLGEVDTNGNAIQPAANLVGGFHNLLDKRIQNELGDEKFQRIQDAQAFYEKTGRLVADAEAIVASTAEEFEPVRPLANSVAELQSEQPDSGPLERLRTALPEADRRMAAMLVRRDAFNLANALEALAGRLTANYAFGIGVIGMAISTIIILMLINGFAICEMLGMEPKGTPHRIGAVIAGLSGALGSFVYAGEAKVWLAVPTSMFGMVLLPIAYFTFFLMLNSKSLLGENRPRGFKRLIWNVLMLVSLALASFGSYWSIKTSDYSTAGYIGLGVFLGLVVLAHFTRRRK